MTNRGSPDPCVANSAREGVDCPWVRLTCYRFSLRGGGRLTAGDGNLELMGLKLRVDLEVSMGWGQPATRKGFVQTERPRTAPMVPRQDGRRSAPACGKQRSPLDDSSRLQSLPVKPQVIRWGLHQPSRLPRAQNLSLCSAGLLMTS